MKNSDALTRTVVVSLKAVAFVGTVFVLVVVALLFLQHRQMTRISPLDFPEMVTLKEMVKADHDNAALKEKVRYLDLAARRDWFAGQEQMRTGAWLLALGVGVVLLSLVLVRMIQGPQKPASMKIVEQNHDPGHDVLALSGVCALLVLGIIFAVRLPVREIESAKESKTAPVWPEVTERELEDNWTRFRGLAGNGAAAGESVVIPDWDMETGRGILWKSEVPLPGFSSPVVWKNRVFLTGGTKDERALFAYDAGDGRLLWRTDAKGGAGFPAAVPEVTSDTGYAAPTPVTNGRVICAVFATGDIICTDMDGKPVWAMNLRVPDNHYGHSSSLLMVGDRLIVQLDDHVEQTLCCIDALTGRILWRKSRETAISWASPIFVKTPQINALVVIDSRYVQAYDVENGNQLWSTECLGGEVAPSPVYHDGKIFVANDMAVAAALDINTGAIVWKTDESYLPSVASPIVYKDMVFLFSNSVTCLDAETGKTLWEQDMPAEFYSSPILFGDTVAAFDVKGTLHVIRPDRESFVEEKQINISEGVVATPAAVGKRMWIRGLKHLISVGAVED